MGSTMKPSGATTPYLKIVAMLLLVVLGLFVVLSIDTTGQTPDDDGSSRSPAEEKTVVEMAVREEIREEAIQKEEEKVRKHSDSYKEQEGSADEGSEKKDSDKKNSPLTLEDVAKELAVDNVILFTVVGEGYVSMFENWAISFIHAIGDPERHNFLAFAKSQEVYQELEKKFPGHAFFLSTEAEESFLDKIDEKEYDRESRNVQLANIRRPLYAMMLLQLGYDAVCTDVDAVFLKNPFRGLKTEDYDVYLPYNDWGNLPKKNDPHARQITPYEKEGHSISGSFLYFKNSGGAKYFLSAWLKKARSVVLENEEKDVSDEGLLRQAIWTDINYNLDLVKIGALPCYGYPASHVFFGLKVGKKDMKRPWREVFKKDIRFVETTWLTDIEGKVQSLKDLKLWHIGDSPAGSD